MGGSWPKAKGKGNRNLATGKDIGVLSLTGKYSSLYTGKVDCVVPTVSSSALEMDELMVYIAESQRHRQGREAKVNTNSM